jgi:hypothetical protein
LFINFCIPYLFPNGVQLGGQIGLDDRLRRLKRCFGAGKFLDCTFILPHRLREHLSVAHVKFCFDEIRLGWARCAQNFPLGRVVLHQPFVENQAAVPRVIENNCRSTEFCL